MKIILNADVATLGEEGDVLEVKPGYARNYLFPRRLGIIHNRQNLALLEGRRAIIEKRKEEKRKLALGDKAKIEEKTITIVMPAGANGRLFGSVTPAMVADEMHKLAVEIERKRIEIPGHTIKQTGDYKVKVRLYGDEVATLTVTIAAEATTSHATADKKTETKARTKVEVEPTAGSVAADAAETSAASEATDAVETSAASEATPASETTPATETVEPQPDTE